MTYLKINNILYSPCSIKKIDCSRIESLILIVQLTNGSNLTVTGLEAIEVAMQAKPSIVEGKRFKFKKFSWIMHNFIGHPLMQILALLRLYKLAIWIHEITIPKPLGVYGDKK